MKKTINSDGILVSYCWCTNHHRGSSLIQQFIICDEKPNKGFTGLNPSVGRAVHLPGSSREESTALAFLASRGYVHSLAHGFLPHLQSQECCVSQKHAYSICTSSSDPDSSDITKQSPHWKSINLITSIKSLLPCTITYSQVLGLA